MDLVKYYQHSCHLLQKESIELVKFTLKNNQITLTYNKYSNHLFHYTRKSNKSFSVLNNHYHDRFFLMKDSIEVECWFKKGLVHRSEDYAYFGSDGQEDVKAFVENGKLLYSIIEDKSSGKKFVNDYDYVDCSLVKNKLLTIKLDPKKANICFIHPEFEQDFNVDQNLMKIFLKSDKPIKKIEFDDFDFYESEDEDYSNDGDEDDYKDD